MGYMQVGDAVLLEMAARDPPLSTSSSSSLRIVITSFGLGCNVIRRRFLASALSFPSPPSLDEDSYAGTSLPPLPPSGISCKSTRGLFGGKTRVQSTRRRCPAFIFDLNGSKAQRKRRHLIAMRLGKRTKPSQLASASCVRVPCVCVRRGRRACGNGPWPPSVMYMYAVPGGLVVGSW
jgi:hypothetical protein